MNIINGYDPEKDRVTIEVQSNLLSKYFNNFSGFIKESPDIPAGTEVTMESENTAKISFPKPEESNISRKSNEVMAIRIDSSKLECFYRAINEFTDVALKKEFKSTEFLPLAGYPVDKLFNDIEVAVKNKRRFCILRSYKDYLDNEEKAKNGMGDYTYDQYVVEFGTSEYADVAILVYQGKMDELRKKFLSKLQITSWI